MVVRIVSALVLVAAIQNGLAAQQKVETAKVGDIVQITMSGDLAKEFAQRLGAKPQVVTADGLEMQTSATVVQQLDGGRLRIEHQSHVIDERKPSRLITLTGNVDSTRITTHVTPKGSLVYSSPGATPVKTTDDMKSLRLELSSLKGLKLRTWTLAEEISQ